jgi:hypothetical protein
VTLERRGETVILRECPFCETDLRPRDGQARNSRVSAAAHLRECEAFYRAMGVDPADPLPLTRAESDARDGRTPTKGGADEVVA